MIETEIEKYRQQAASKKAEADFWKRDRKTLERQMLEKDNTIKKQTEELCAQKEDLTGARIKQAELQVALQALQDKLESMQSKEDQKASPERPRASYRAQSGPKHHPGQHFQTRNPRHAFPIAHSCTGSAAGSPKNHRKHEDVFRGGERQIFRIAHRLASIDC
uniref:Uncharacterized protein n=1 Tax=Magallana gigas TaxID=29159 RepID=A0A8W8JMV6_MAGGI